MNHRKKANLSRQNWHRSSHQLSLQRQKTPLLQLPSMQSKSRVHLLDSQRIQPVSMIKEQSHQALILFHIHQAIVDHCAELLWLACRLWQAPGGMGTKDHFAISFGGTWQKRAIHFRAKSARNWENKEKTGKCWSDFKNYVNYVPNNL